ncbi:MAG: flagellar basal body P-ring protein FlgI [Candidatus Saganbacteria bacterium]|nr:flagellar basal body P-ring protein FlgI [Candidatus Saganbacteria bacterium]
MKNYKILLLTVLLLVVSCQSLVVYAASPSVRVKDIAHILEARDNQLMGFGLVVGLRNTGDSSRTGFTQQAMTNLLSKMGVMPQGISFKSRNVAAVMVTANLKPYVKSGQKLDVTVSSMGDATSLQGGTLLTAPLKGIDQKVYAVAQGSLIVGAPQVIPNLAPMRRSRETVGRIPNGALVEKEVPISFADQSELTIVLNDPDYTTASRMVDSIKKAKMTAWAQDAGTVIVPVVSSDIVSVMAKIENLRLTPDSVAKVVVSERTGTIVIGENVKLSPSAVSFGGIHVVIGNIKLAADGGENYTTSLRSRATARLSSRNKNLKIVSATPTLSTLVKALNALSASPQDLISILQAMKKAGALKAELEVI